jgi:hypothetical protein
MASINGETRVDGAPSGGVYVRLIGPSGEFVSEQYTKDDGRFTFHVAPGAWTLEAKAAGAGTQRQVVEVARDEDTLSDVAVELSRAG